MGDLLCFPGSKLYFSVLYCLWNFAGAYFAHMPKPGS